MIMLLSLDLDNITNYRYPEDSRSQAWCKRKATGETHPTLQLALSQP